MAAPRAAGRARPAVRRRRSARRPGTLLTIASSWPGRRAAESPPDCDAVVLSFAPESGRARLHLARGRGLAPDQLSGAGLAPDCRRGAVAVPRSGRRGL